MTFYKVEEKERAHPPLRRALRGRGTGVRNGGGMDYKTHAYKNKMGRSKAKKKKGGLGRRSLPRRRGRPAARAATSSHQPGQAGLRPGEQGGRGYGATATATPARPAAGGGRGRGQGDWGRNRAAAGEGPPELRGGRWCDGRDRPAVQRGGGGGGGRRGVARAQRRVRARGWRPRRRRGRLRQEAVQARVFEFQSTEAQRTGATAGGPGQDALEVEGVAGEKRERKR